MDAPTNPAYMVDPTFFQATNGVDLQSPAHIEVPPVSIFVEALRPDVIRTTGFLPRHLPRSVLSTVFFSEANLRWLQQQIVTKTNTKIASPLLKIALPDPTNLQLIMEERWNRFYREGGFSSQRNVQTNLAYLNAFIIEQCVLNMTQGVSAQVDYVDKVTKGPNYEDPFLKTVSVGDAKLSTSGGTLNTSSVVFGTNKPTTAGLVPTPSSSTRVNINTTDWSAIAAEDAAFQVQGGFRDMLDQLP